MMNGTDEIDGIVTKPNSFDQIPLRSRRLQRKLRPFAGTLTDAQRQIARDVILLMFGPTRILLCPTVADELGMDGEMRLAILKNALAMEDAFEANLLKSKARAFTAVVDKLTPQQRRQLSERVGLSLEELARRYAPIREESFALDFPPN